MIESNNGLVCVKNVGGGEMYKCLSAKMNK